MVRIKDFSGDGSQARSRAIKLSYIILCHVKMALKLSGKHAQFL